MNCDADVAGHDDDGVLEVDGAALAVGQAAVVEDLEQDVEDVRVRLFDLVEEDDLVGPAADGLGELAALFVADVAGGRADQPRDRGFSMYSLMSMRIMRLLVVEEELGERARELGLADAGRAEEDERADGAACGSLRPARARRTASETAATASSWPMTRSWRRSSMWRSFSRSPSIMRVTGMPVQAATTSAMSSASTSSLSSAPRPLESAMRRLLRRRAARPARAGRPYLSSAALP